MYAQAACVFFTRKSPARKREGSDYKKAADENPFDGEYGVAMQITQTVRCTARRHQTEDHTIPVVVS